MTPSPLRKGISNNRAYFLLDNMCITSDYLIVVLTLSYITFIHQFPHLNMIPYGIYNAHIQSCIISCRQLANSALAFTRWHYLFDTRF